MDDKKIFIGFGAVIAVLLVAALARVMTDDGDTRAMIADEMTPVNDAVAALEGRLSDMQSAVDTLSEQTAGAASQVDLEAVQSQLEALAGQSGDLDARLAEMSEAMAAATATPEPVPEAPTAEPDAAATQPQDEEPGAPGATPGQTLLLADGALRVFISRLDSQADQAHVSIDGQILTLDEGVGRTFPVGDDFCKLVLTDVSGAGALIDATCGDDLPAPEGISAGETALLDDGALRVFASRVTDDSARLSAGGIALDLHAGGSVSVMFDERACRVTLDQVDRGHATVSAVCSDAVSMSDPISPGSTAVLGDGAARVFLAAVQDGTARFAVNGQTLLSGAAGDNVALDGDCTLGIEAVRGDTASFSHVCYN